LWAGVHPKGSGGGTVRLQPTHPNQNFKKTDFVDTKISMVSSDSPFSNNQTLKSAEDQFTEISEKN